MSTQKEPPEAGLQAGPAKAVEHIKLAPSLSQRLRKYLPEELALQPARTSTLPIFRKIRSEQEPQVGRSSDRTGSPEAASKRPEVEFKLSKRRWWLLAGVCIYGYTNGLTNELFALLHTLVSLLEIPLEEYVYIWQVFYYVVPVMGLPTAWFVDRFGIRGSLLTSVALATLRNLLRALLFWPTSPLWPQLRLFYWIAYNLLVQQAVLIYYCLPLKISESWFSKRERSVAWSLIVICPVLGASSSSLTWPRFVSGAESMHLLAYLNLVCIPVVALAIMLGCTRSTPQHYPSERARLNDRSFGANGGESSPEGQSHFAMLLRNLKHLSHEWNVICQIFTIAAFDMFILTINTILQDILSASGFTQVQTGQFMATMQLASAILQTCSSFFVSPAADDDDDDDEHHEEREPAKAAEKSEAETKNRAIVRKCKLYMVLICASFLLYALALSLRDYPRQQWWLAISGSLAYTVLRFWAAPSYNDLHAYLISGHISQATVSAFQMILQAFMGVLFSVMFIYLRRSDKLPLTEAPKLEHSNSTSGAFELAETAEQQQRPDYSRSVLFLAVMAVFSTLVYLLAFDGRKKQSERLAGGEPGSEPKSEPREGVPKRSLVRASTLPLELSIPAGSLVRFQRRRQLE